MNNTQTEEFSKKFIEDLLTFFEINTEIDINYSDDILEISIPSNNYNSILIGKNAETLRSIQYILSNILRNNNAKISRVNIDIADYKKLRNEKLIEKAKKWFEKVQKNNKPYSYNLNASDRRIVHNLASEYEDIETKSEGEGRERKIIIYKK